MKNLRNKLLVMLFAVALVATSLINSFDAKAEVAKKQVFNPIVKGKGTITYTLDEKNSYIVQPIKVVAPGSLDMYFYYEGNENNITVALQKTESMKFTGENNIYLESDKEEADFFESFKQPGTYYLYIVPDDAQDAVNKSKITIKYEFIDDIDCATVNKVKAGANKLTITIKKMPAYVSGYEISVKQVKVWEDIFKEKGVKKVKVTNPKKLTTTIKGLKSGKKYMIQARAYVNVNGKKYYSLSFPYKKVIKVK